jgi:anti-sigma B factor antagonist
MGLQIRQNHFKEGAFVLSPEGSLDSYSYETLEHAVIELLHKKTRHILVDMAKVDYISSLGLSCIIRLIKTAKEFNAHFAIYDSQQEVQRVLQLSKLEFLEINPENLDPAHPFFDYIQAAQAERADKQKEIDKRERKKKRYE